MKARFFKHTLKFKQPAGTSRGVMSHRDVWFIEITDPVKNISGIGEIAPLPGGLSIELNSDFEAKIRTVVDDIYNYKFWIEQGLLDYPSIRFGLEIAIRDLQTGGQKILFPSGFTQGKSGIDINGLVWMGDADFMKQQVRNKIDQGFRCIKLKIGALDFDTEFEILKSIRKDFSADEMEIRVDANGAFTADNSVEILEKLAGLEIHSIEQPIKKGQWDVMADLCNQKILPVALDEELIGINLRQEKVALLLSILPDYIILKPSLHGGFAGCTEWIEIAESLKIGWWITSALESNIGLNAIAQWAATLNNPMPQGLGTGQLFTNNIPSPLEIKDAKLHFNPRISWDLSLIK
jgi:o-succinylbenzoate synthase